MCARQRDTGRPQFRQLLLLAVMSVALAGTASSSGNDVDFASMPLSGPADEISLAAATRVPSVTTSPEPTMGAERSPSHPSGQTASDAERISPAVAETMRASAPIRLRIPSIGVDSPLMALGLQGDRTLEVPPSGFPAGWYTGAPTPGELGPAIIAGHVDWGGQPGVFFDLRELSPGDEIVVSRHDGSTARFRVTRVDQFAKDAFPTQAVYGDLDHAGLRLITCGGSFDRRMRSYVDNLVVFAEFRSAGA